MAQGPSPSVSQFSNVVGTRAQMYQPYQTNGPSLYQPNNGYYYYTPWAGAWPPYISAAAPAPIAQTPVASLNTSPTAEETLSESPDNVAFAHWDEIFRKFLEEANLNQTLRGFEDDMLILNEEWEHRGIVGGALVRLVDRLTKREKELPPSSPSLDTRKLAYVHLANNAEPHTPSSVNKSISALLSRSRAQNDESNRSEFLYTPAEKRARLGVDTPSCARVDAKPVDRDVQMKYDIAKNDGGPLWKTMKGGGGGMNDEARSAKPVASTPHFSPPDEMLAPDGRPELDERLRNAEEHLAVRYVPSPPRTLLARLKFLEDHIIRLEKDYPPWAALHFNQPNRGWPPPPRATPIIVPPHLRPVESPTTNEENAKIKPGSGKAKNSTSSLHRAVLERLEVQQAMSEFTKGA